MVVCDVNGVLTCFFSANPLAPEPLKAVQLTNTATPEILHEHCQTLYSYVSHPSLKLYCHHRSCPETAFSVAPKHYPVTMGQSENVHSMLLCCTGAGTQHVHEGSSGAFRQRLLCCLCM